MLGHEIAADALTQVIVPPVLAVDVDDHRLPGLVDDGGVRDLVDQAALQAVDQTGPYGVVAADAQHKRFVLLKGPVGEDGGVEVALAQAGLGDQLQRLLRHVQRVLADDAHCHTLAEDGGAAVSLEHFGISLPPLLAVQAVNRGRAPEGDAVISRQVDRRAILIETCREHACLVVPQFPGVDHQRYDRQGKIGFHDEACRHGLGGLHARYKRAHAQGSGRHDLDGAGIRLTLINGGDAAIGGVTDFCPRLGCDAQHHIILIQAAWLGKNRPCGKAREAGAVRLAGCWRVIIKKAVPLQ